MGSAMTYSIGRAAALMQENCVVLDADAAAMCRETLPTQ